MDAHTQTHTHTHTHTHAHTHTHPHKHTHTHLLTWLEPPGPNVGRNYDHLIFLSSLSTSRSMSRFTNVLLFDCLDLVEFPSCHPVTHEQLFAGTGNCVQSPFQSCSIASLAWLGTRPPCPLHCYLALGYRDDTHTHPRARAQTDR